MNRITTLWFRLLLLQVVLLVSCAYIPKEVDKPISSLPDLQKTKQCKKITARFGLIDHLPFEIKYLRHSEISDTVPLENAPSKLVWSIKESDAFNFSNDKDNSKDLIFGYTVYRETQNYGLLWFPALTLGIIPAKMTTDYSLGVRVFNADGEFLKEYKSSVESFDYYVGLWFIPLAKSDRALNLRDIENKHLPKFFNEILQQMKKDKIIFCD